MTTTPNPISGRLGRSRQRVAATAAGLIVAIGIVIGIVIGTAGSADASLLESVHALGDQTDTALEDGVLSADEAADLQGMIDEIVAHMESSHDLADLATGELEIVLGALGSIRRDLVVAAGDESAAAAGALNSGLAQVSAGVRTARSTRSAGEFVIALPSSTSDTAVAQLFGLEDLPLTVIAGEAGSVEISAGDGGLFVSRTNAAAGWTAEIDTPSGQTISVTFSDDGVTVQVSAELTGDGVTVTTTADHGNGDNGKGDHGNAGDGDGDGDGAGDGDRDGVQRFEIDGEPTHLFEFDAGSVTISVTETAIDDLSGEANEGWSVENERIAGRSGRVDFLNEDGDQVQFKAEVTGGELQVKIQLIEKGDDEDDPGTSELDETTTDDSTVEDEGEDEEGENDKSSVDRVELDGERTETFTSEAGTVTITVTETGIEALAFEAAGGWTVEDDHVSGREVRVLFENEDGDKVQFKAELAGGHLLVKFDDVTGDGDEAELSDEDDDGEDDKHDDHKDEASDGKGNRRGSGSGSGNGNGQADGHSPGDADDESDDDESDDDEEDDD